MGDKLTDSDGKVMFIESVNTEVADEAVYVYNFQVEDTHTYYVGNKEILVHNANSEYLVQNADDDFKLPGVFDNLSEESKLKQLESLKKMSDSEREMYFKIANNEPEITLKVQEITAKAGGNLEGLEFRLKTPSSTYEKIYLREESTPISEMNDVIRYTEIFEPGKLAEGANLSLKEFEANGYTIAKVKNTWCDPSRSYKGINTTIVSPEGQAFELQFHTMESFDLKNGELHSLYEQYRVLPANDPMKIQLNDKMFELSGKLQVPDNINEVINK